MFHEPHWPLSFYTKGESFQEFSEFFLKILNQNAVCVFSLLHSVLEKSNVYISKL